MSAKLIQSLKRKREESVVAGSSNDSSDRESSSDNKREKVCECENSRPDLDHGVKSNETENYNKQTEDVNKSEFLLEALKKVVELQKELEEIGDDHDGDNDDEEYYSSDDSDCYYSHGNTRNYEAEALGFAVCARETLLFLQKEGIPQDSLIYRSLRDRLVARS